jgi:hypothetical protein
MFLHSCFSLIVIAGHIVRYPRIPISADPYNRPSDIGLKGSQTDLISDIGLTFLAISDIRYLSPDSSDGSHGNCLLL